MRKFFKPLAVLIIISFIFSSCKNKMNNAKMVPADAILVSFFDTKSMLDKMPYNDIKATQIYKDAYADSTLPEWGKKMLEDPQQAGIDLDKGLFVFVNKGIGNSANIVVEGVIKNQSDFEKFNKNLDASAQVIKEKDISIMVLKNKSVVGWNGKDFIYVINAAASKDEMQNFSDSTLPKLPGGDIEEAKAYCRRLFSLPQDSSLAGDKRFSKLMDEKGDMKVWMNNERLMDLSPQMGMLSMLKLNDLIKDNRSTFAVTFENGKIEVDQKIYVSENLFKLAKKYQGDNISADQISKIPSNDIVGFMALNYKPEGLKEFVKMIGMDGMVNMYTNQMGFSLDDFVAAQNGHWTFSLSDLMFPARAPASDSNYFSKSSPDFNFLVTMGIGDKTHFDKVYNIMKGFLGKDEDTTVNFSVNDKMLAVSNHKTFADGYLSGKGANKLEWASDMTDHPMGMYIDINQILTKSNNTVASDSTAGQMLQKSIGMWQNIISKGGEAKDGAIEFETNVNLVDKNTNSLKQLNNYIDQMYQLEKKRRSSSTASVDSLLVPPPVDTVHIP